MFVIMKVTRNDADLITYHLPVTSQKEGPPVVFVGCYLCGCYNTAAYSDHRVSLRKEKLISFFLFYIIYKYNLQ
jgi:hypothetical protein